jgi:SAM-dependent methyltransferase
MQSQAQNALLARFATGGLPVSELQAEDRRSRRPKLVYKNDGNPFLLDLLPQPPGVALDCGCGAGDNARILCDRGWRVHGVTWNALERDLASRYCAEVSLFDLNNGLPENVKRSASKFDVVVLSHILEHLVDPSVLLLEVRNVLSPHGVIAVALPNVVSWPNRLRILVGRFDYQPSGIMDESHLHFYTFASGGRLLRDSGYEIVRAKAEGGFPLWRIRALLPARWVEALNATSCRLFPGFFGGQSVYIARPAAPLVG